MLYIEMMNDVQRRLGITETKTTQNKIDSDLIQLNSWFNEQLAELKQINLWSFLQRMYYLPRSNVINANGNFGDNENILSVIPTTTGIIANEYIVSGIGIQPNTRVISVLNPFQVSIDKATILPENFPQSPVLSIPITFTQDTFDLPDDFDRVTDQTIWNGSLPLSKRDPRTPNQWQWLKNMNWTFPSPQVRFFGNKIRINPPGFKGQLSFEYVSNSPVLDQDGITYKQRFTSDNDTTLFDNEVIVLGVIARWRIHQKYDGNAELELYERRKSQMIARDGGSQVLSLNNRFFPW